VSVRPYHHGDLRQALLEGAEETLRRGGTDGLSLRELAREIGVSHAAPRRHFSDKRALLDALALDGFRRLSAALNEAAERNAQTFAARLTAVAVAYVEFATQNAALLELMFTGKHQPDASADLRLAANSSFDLMFALVREGQAAGELAAGDLEQIGTVFFALLQGITSLANTDMLDRSQLDTLTAYCLESLLRGLAPHQPAP
jgi:AcrR family transcriptional regulator